jgi:hypothetical protein
VFVYVCAFFYVCVQVEALRRADHPSKESYRLSLIKKLRKLSPIVQKREQAPKCESNEEEKKKGKAIPVRGRGGPHGCEKSRLLHFLDNRLRDGGEVVSLMCRPSFTPKEDSWYSFLLGAESTPRP